MAKNIQTVHECMFQIAEGVDLCHANLPYPKVTLPQRKGFVNHHSLLTVGSTQSSSVFMFNAGIRRQQTLR